MFVIICRLILYIYPFLIIVSCIEPDKVATKRDFIVTLPNGLSSYMYLCTGTQNSPNKKKTDHLNAH